MQHCNVQPEALIMQHEACNVQHATVIMRQSMKQATCNMRHATCDKRHATCNAQHAAFNMKRATSDKPLTCDSRHTACTLYHVSRNRCRARPQAAWDTMPRAAPSRGISNIRRLNLGALLRYAYATVRRPRRSPESMVRRTSDVHRSLMDCNLPCTSAQHSRMAPV